MSDLQKVRIQLYDENNAYVNDVDVMTSADCVLFSDGQTFQEKLAAGTLKGAKGDTGAAGAKGATGATGAAGTAATIAVGTVTTGVAGSNAAVTNGGTAAAAVFNFTIPRGATGATGPQGPKGEIGATGAAGQKGSQAYTGTGITGTSTTAAVFSTSGVSSAQVNDLYFNTSTGNFYQCTVAGAATVAKWVYKGSFKGPKGDTGTQGPKGDTGAAGATGAQGPKGDTGATGAKGATGAQGPAGATGPKGDPGDTIRVGTAYASAVQRKIFFKVVE